MDAFEGDALLSDHEAAQLQPAHKSGPGGLDVESSGTEEGYAGRDWDWAGTSPKTPGGAGGSGSGSTPYSTNSRIDLVLLMLHALLGTSVLALPACFRLCGVLLGTLTLVLCVVATHFALYMFVLTARAVGGTSYLQVVELALGERMRLFAKGCTLLLQLGSLVASVNVFTDVLSFSAGGIIPPGADNVNTWHVVVLVGMLPFMFYLRTYSYSMLRTVAYPSIVMVLGFVFLFIVQFAKRNFEGKHTHVIFVQPEGSLAALPVIVAGLNTILYTVFEFPEFSAEERVGAIRICLMACLALYWLVGVLGYLVYGENTAGDVLRNLDGLFLGNGNTRMVKAIFGINMLLTVPTYAQPLLQSTAKFLAKHSGTLEWCLELIPNPSVARVKEAVLWCGSFSLVLLALSASVFLPNLEFSIGLTGATAGIMSCFFFPCYAYLKLAPEMARSAKLKDSPEEWILSMVFPHLDHHLSLRKLAKVITSLGVMGAITCTGYTVYGIEQEAVVVRVAKLLASLNDRHQQIASQLNSAEGIITSLKDVEQTKVEFTTSMQAAQKSVSEASAMLDLQKEENLKGNQAVPQELALLKDHLVNSELDISNLTKAILQGDGLQGNATSARVDSRDVVMLDKANTSLAMNSTRQNIMSTVDTLRSLERTELHASHQRSKHRTSVNSTLVNATESLLQAEVHLEAAHNLAQELDDKNENHKAKLSEFISATDGVGHGMTYTGGSAVQGLAVVNMTNPEALNQSNMVIEKVEKLERDKAQVSDSIEYLLRTQQAELGARAMRIATAMSALTGAGTGSAVLNMSEVKIEADEFGTMDQPPPAASTVEKQLNTSANELEVQPR